MSLAYGLRNIPIRENVAYEDYAKLLSLRSLNEKQTAQLKQLMIDLDLRVDDVTADEKVVKQIIDLRAKIDMARHEAPKLQGAEAAARAYRSQTEQLVAARTPEQNRLNDIASGIGGILSDAHAAVEEINKLKAENPRLLAHEPRAMPTQLTA